MIAYTFCALTAIPLLGEVVCYEYMTITSTGEANGVHVLTDYVPKKDTVVRAKFASSSSSNSGNNQFLFCSRYNYEAKASSKHFSFAPNVNSLFRWDYYDKTYSAGSSFAANADYELEIRDGQATITKVIDPTKVVVLGPATGPANYSPEYKMALFQSYTISGSDYQGWSNSFHGRFYYIKFFDIENGVEVLKHWFVPCTDDGVVKICDLADNDRLYPLVKSNSGGANVDGAPVLDLGDPKLGDCSIAKTAGGYDVTIAMAKNSATVKALARTSAADANPIVEASAAEVAAGDDVTLTLSGFTADTTYEILAVAENASGASTEVSRNPDDGRHRETPPVGKDVCARHSDLECQDEPLLQKARLQRSPARGTLHCARVAI